MATSSPMVPTPTNHGMGHEEALYRGIALAQLRILKQQMQLGNLFIGNRRVRLDNGVEIIASICGNKEDIRVRIPKVSFKYQRVVDVFTWFASPLGQNNEGLRIPYHFPGESEGGLPSTGIYDADSNRLNLRKNLVFGNRHFVDGGQAHSWNGPLSIYGVLSSPITAKYVFLNGSVVREFGEDQIVLAYGFDQYEVALVATYKRNAYDDLVTATYPPVLMVWKQAEVPLTHTFVEGQLDGGPYFVGSGGKIMFASGGFITYAITDDDKLNVTVTKAVDTRQQYAATIVRSDDSTETVVTYGHLKYSQLYGAVGQLVVEYLTDISSSKTVGTGSNNITVDLPVKFPITVPVFYGALTAYQADIWRVCFDSDPSKVSTVQAMSFCADDGSGAQIISSGQSCSDFVNNVQHPSSGSVNTVTTCSGTSIQVQVSQNGYSDTINISKTANGQTWVQTSYKSGPIGEMPEVSAAFVASGIRYIYGTFEAWYFNGAWNNYPPSVDTQVSNCLVATGEAGDCTFATPSKLPVGGASNYTRYFHNTCFGNCNFATVEVYEARCL